MNGWISDESVIKPSGPELILSLYLGPLRSMCGYDATKSEIR